MLVARAPGEDRQTRPDQDGKKRPFPTQAPDVSEVRAQERKEVAHDEARIEVAKQCSPPVARRPEGSANRRPPARARAFVAGHSLGVTGEAPSHAREPERKIHVLVVGEEGALEDLSVWRHAFQ